MACLATISSHRRCGLLSAWRTVWARCGGPSRAGMMPARWRWRGPARLVVFVNFRRQYPAAANRRCGARGGRGAPSLPLRSRSPLPYPLPSVVGDLSPVVVAVFTECQPPIEVMQLAGAVDHPTRQCRHRRVLAVRARPGHPQPAVTRRRPCSLVSLTRPPQSFSGWSDPPLANLDDRRQPLAPITQRRAARGAPARHPRFASGPTDGEEPGIPTPASASAAAASVAGSG